MSQLKFRKKVVPSEIKRRYRLSFSSENTLHEIWSVRFTRVRILITIIFILLALASLISTIIVTTPLRTFLPGYIKSEQRYDYIQANLRVDSLENAIAQRNKYFENLREILSGELPSNAETQTVRNTDSIGWAFNDSLLLPSDREKEFIKAFDEREQFNVAVLTPLAAQRIVFASPIAIKGITHDNHSEFTPGLEISAPVGTPVSAIYDGTVIGVDHTIANGIHVTIQHPEGFISQYLNLQNCYVQKGTKVSAAQRIGTSGSSDFIIELWHNGIAVNPTDFIPF